MRPATNPLLPSLENRAALPIWELRPGLSLPKNLVDARILFDMLPRRELLHSIRLVAAAVCACLAISCHRQPDSAGGDPDSGLAGEPEQFSATVIRSLEDGAERDLRVTRIFKSGDLRREEWIEQGESRAVIWRADLGKSYLLDLDRRLYVESDSRPDTALRPERESTSSESAAAPEESEARSSALIRDGVTAESVERSVGSAPLPVGVESRSLSDRTIDGHPCAVIERRETFASGHVEVTTCFRARDLRGLAIRIEIGPVTGTNGAKLVTKWRDILIDVPADVFVVPSDFKKVDKLMR